MKKILIILLSLLLIPSYSYAGKWHTNMKKQEKKDFANYVLRNQSKNKMVFNLRNVPNRPGLIKFFDKLEDRMGVAEKGIEINLSYSDVGDKFDWSRLGEPGFAQRFNIMEPYKHTTKKGKTKWYRVGYFIPEDTRTDKHTLTIFDFKKLYKKGEKTVDATFRFTNNELSWQFNSTKYIAGKGEGGSEQFFFESYVVNFDPLFSPLKGKWVNVLLNAKWAKDGFLHLWIDGKLRSSYYGDTMSDATSARFKFGPYRHHMTQATDSGFKIPDVKVRYSNVGKADKCEDLWSGCSEIISQLTDKSQLNGVRVVVYCKSAFKSDGGASCRNLGYPKNPRPF